MSTFTVRVRTDAAEVIYTAIARTPWDAEASARIAQGDTPCGITVLPIGGAQ